jgi:hypothetical protein
MDFCCRSQYCGFHGGFVVVWFRGGLVSWWLRGGFVGICSPAVVEQGRLKNSKINTV